ncbi:glycoside/pentoside/hexuronide:cation symporter, GPH family [Desulfacinum infernum DSM 9756]|uniref:Glycoside/pentoside/hexuronide:cation symporter, GPH family n=1 Tax=Desulfacinum infernum DSM 9756 TaxID=1121391 RepID=A0A1M5FUQ4_9BACT|nr:MFS transporter [Desulfacinum infernum]SHF95223.1 glycoside/pentoside/hexuronide:cation symporter, GPH family [Desulfacinum infernum DSM 9756]
MRQVPARIRLAYALPALALAVVGLPLYVHIPKFYTDTVGLQASWVGAVLLFVRIFDAFTDPLLGRISDHTRTRWGRRRPYLLFGTFPLAVSLWLLFNPPAAEIGSSFGWFAVSIFCVFLFWTAVEVPYEAWGPEITLDYDERTRLLGTRDGFVMVGIVLAVASPALLGRILDLGADSAGERAKFMVMGGLYAPILVAACWMCAWLVTEREWATDPRKTAPNFLQDLRRSLENRPFVILLIAYTISSFGNNLPATLILYYVQYVLGSSKADVFLMVYFLTGILFLPGWIALARRIGKKRGWLLAMAVNTGAFAGVFFLGYGDETAYGILVALSGVGFGGALALPSAMQADVIDYHQWLTGDRLEGFYVGVWSVAKKLSAALGVGLGLWLLGRAGYEPNVMQSEPVIFRLRLLYALVPCLSNVLSMAVAWAYPLDRAAHRALIRAIEQRGAET